MRCLLLLAVALLGIYTISYSQVIILQHFETILANQSGVSGLSDVGSIAVSHDGKNVYTGSSYYGDKAVAVFSRDNINGHLNFLEMHQDGLNGVDGINCIDQILISPDDKIVYVISGGDLSGCKNSIAYFSRNLSNGKLTFISKTNWVKGTSGGEISPDNKFLYATNESKDAVGVFRINANTGALELVKEYVNNQEGVTGLDGATNLTISSDGKNVYVCSFWDASVVAFSISQDSGLLTFLEVYKNGVNGVTGLSWANPIIAAPDGKNIYVGAAYNGELTSFSRNSNTGLLNYLNTFKDNTNGIDGLSSPSALCVHPNGKYLFVSAEKDKAISAFERSLADGKLVFQNATIDNTALAYPEDIAISPDGKHLYAVSSWNVTGRIAIFIVNIPTNSIDDNENQIPSDFHLAQNYPNPFNPSTIIKYSVPRLSFVQIKIYDLVGREIKTLISEEKHVGNYEIKYNANDITSGIYFCKMIANGFNQTKKIVFIK